MRTVSEQILFHKKLLKLDKEELKRLIPETQSTRKIKDRTYNTYTYLIKKNEREICVAQPILTAAACMKIRVVVKF